MSQIILKIHTHILNCSGNFADLRTPLPQQQDCIYRSNSVNFGNIRLRVVNKSDNFGNIRLCVGNKSDNFGNNRLCVVNKSETVDYNVVNTTVAKKCLELIFLLLTIHPRKEETKQTKTTNKNTKNKTKYKQQQQNKQDLL